MANGSDDSFMFGDNFLVVNPTVIPSGKIQRQYRILNYHCTRGAQEKVIIKFLHMNGNYNPAGILTKIRASNTYLPLMKPLILWNDMNILKERDVAEGGGDMSSTPSLSQAKVTPHKLFKLDIWHILGD